MPSKTLLFLSVVLSACLVRGLAVAESNTAPAKLSAGQIVEKHVAARGGLQAWRAVHTLSMSGKLDVGSGDSVERSRRAAQEGAGVHGRRAQVSAATDAAKAAATQQVQLPFRLEMKRPRKSRLEIDFAGKTAVQVYDGQNGWKVRPFLNRDEVEPFTADETKAEAANTDLDGPLVDYAARGTEVTLEGTDSVDGHTAYRLKLTQKSGSVRHVWIDAQSFLDVKVEGAPRRIDGKMHTVWIYQRDFRAVEGVKVPYLLETAIEGNPQTHRMVIDSVTVNRALDDARFAKPLLVAATQPGVAPVGAAPTKK